MPSPRTIGRWIGLGMLAEFGLGIYSNFGLQARLFAPPGLLINAGLHPDLIGAVVAMGLFASLLSLLLAIAFATLLRDEQPTLTRLYTAIAAAGLALSVVEHGLLHAFAELAASHAAAPPAHPDPYIAAAKSLSGLRNGVHFLDKSLGGLSVALFFSLAFRGAWLPRFLAGFGVLAALCQIAGIAPALLGDEVRTFMLAPLALAYLSTAFWLLARGFPHSASISPIPPSASDTETGADTTS